MFYIQQNKNHDSTILSAVLEYFLGLERMIHQSWTLNHAYSTPSNLTPLQNHVAVTCQQVQTGERLTDLISNHYTFRLLLLSGHCN